jgi:hypothetical protein
MTVPAPQTLPPLSAAEAAATGRCQRCHAPGSHPIRIRHSGNAPGGWVRLLVCTACIALAEADPQYTVLRAVEVSSG